jgi:hypothetical protein
MGAADFTAVAEEPGTKSNRQVKNKMQVMRRDYLQLVASSAPSPNLVKGLSSCGRASHTSCPAPCTRLLAPVKDLWFSEAGDMSRP